MKYEDNSNKNFGVAGKMVAGKKITKVSIDSKLIIHIFLALLLIVAAYFGVINKNEIFLFLSSITGGL